jgi:hypothetical protein
MKATRSSAAGSSHVGAWRGLSVVALPSEDAKGEGKVWVRSDLVICPGNYFMRRLSRLSKLENRSAYWGRTSSL